MAHPFPLVALLALHAQPVVITRTADVEGAVGKNVTLRGVVANNKIATLLGADVASDSPDLRGQEALATGTLQRQVVTQHWLDGETAAHGQFAHRGPGTFYQLIDPKTGRLAQVQRVEAGVPGGRFELEEKSPSLTLQIGPELRLRLSSPARNPHPAEVAEGPYTVTALKTADYHLSFTVDRVEGPAMSAVETPMRVGQVLRLTLSFACLDGKNGVQLCLHDAGDDRHQAICRTLRDWSSHCTEGPAIDGSRINAPPRGGR